MTTADRHGGRVVAGGVGAQRAQDMCRIRTAPV